MTDRKSQKIIVKGIEIVTFLKKESDYISLTDIAKFKDKERTEYVVQNWMRNRDTIEFLGIWEHLNNPGFKHIEFDVFRVDVTQLVVLANLEGMNAELIRQGLPQSKRLTQLNQIAITQMRSLIGNVSIKKLK